MSNGITIDALLAEWRKFDAPNGDGGQTVKEIAKSLEIPENKVRDLLYEAIEAGRVRNFRERRVCVMRNNQTYMANVFKVVDDGV